MVIFITTIKVVVAALVAGIIIKRAVDIVIMVMSPRLPQPLQLSASRVLAPRRVAMR